MTTETARASRLPSRTTVAVRHRDVPPAGDPVVVTAPTDVPGRPTRLQETVHPVLVASLPLLAVHP